MILIYIIVLFLLWYLNVLAITAIVGTKKRKHANLVVFLIFTAALGISILSFFVPVIICVSVLLVIIGKITKII